MDQDLIEYLDRRFTELSSELRAELRSDFRDELTATTQMLRGELAGSAADTRRALREEIAASAAETRSVLHAEIAASAAETRRHFDVVAEQLMSEIQLVAEGVIGVDQKVDRLAAEMRTEFQNVDRRILHLEARVLNRD